MRPAHQGCLILVDWTRDEIALADGEINEKGKGMAVSGSGRCNYIFPPTEWPPI